MLEISDLKAGYGQTVIVDMPTLTLAPGEHCLILGASGSGKTTLLYAIAGLLELMQGNIRLNGTSMSTMTPVARDAFRGQHIGIIYQTLHMVGALSVLENILLVPYAAGLPQDAAKAALLLHQLGLYDYRNRKPDALSQGQQQRVAIARAAIHSPALIIGDEPTSALDDAACHTVMELLFAAAKEAGASLIVATHDSRISKYFTNTITLGSVA